MHGDINANAVLLTTGELNRMLAVSIVISKLGESLNYVIFMGERGVLLLCGKFGASLEIAKTQIIYFCKRN